MKSLVKLPAILLLAVIYSSVAYSGIFADLRKNSPSVALPRQTASTIFKKNIGAANPVQWARRLPGVENPEIFLSSQTWENTCNDFLQVYGNNTEVNQYLSYQEFLFRRAILVNNIASSRSNDIKGYLAESLMDDYFVKDGWEIIDGKRGRNGFDGLYVKRNKNGTIKDWIAAEAKSGNSKQQMTSRGLQLSPEWVDGNLQDLLKIAQDKANTANTISAQKRLSDIKQIINLKNNGKGRKPCLFNAKIKTINGKTHYQIIRYDVDGKIIGKPLPIDMQTKNIGKMQKLVYKNLKKHISNYVPEKAETLVQKIKVAFQKGKIKNDSDLYRFIKREIPDKRLAAAVTQKLGEVPPRGTLAGTIGKNISRHSGVILSATTIAGFIIARDAVQNGITSKTFLEAGFAATTTLAIGVAADYTMNWIVTNTSKYVAKKMLEQTGEKATKKATKALADKIAPTLGKGLGLSIQLAFALYSVGNSIYNYYNSNITQKDMLVNIGIVSITTAGTVFFTMTKAGAAIGTAIFPGAGTVIGIGIGVIGGVLTGGYTLYTELERQKNILFEQQQLAKWEKENNEERLTQRISELQKEAEQMRKNAWGMLLKTHL